MEERILDNEAPQWLLSRALKTDGCWLWTGSKLRRYGGSGGDRAVIKLPGQPTRNVARALWIELRGTITHNVIRHTCDNAMCVHPTHLIPGTFKENSNDARQRKRFRPGGVAMQP